MSKTSKAILGFSVASILFSFTELGGHIYFGILLPIGAVAFIVFFIVNMLSKEMKRFDEDHAVQSEEKKGATATRPTEQSLPTLKTSH